MENLNDQFSSSSLTDNSVQTQMLLLQQQLDQQKKLNAKLTARLNPFAFKITEADQKNVEWFRDQFKTAESALQQVLNEPLTSYGMIRCEFAAERTLKKRGIEKKEGCLEKKFATFCSHATTALSSLSKLQEDYEDIARRRYEASASGKKSRLMAEKRKRVEDIQIEARKKMRRVESMHFIDDEAEEADSSEDGDNFC